MAGTLGTANAMFISRHDLGVVVIVRVALRQAARALGREKAGFSPPTGPMAAGLAALSEELDATARNLREPRERSAAATSTRPPSGVGRGRAGAKHG